METDKEMSHRIGICSTDLPFYIEYWNEGTSGAKLVSLVKHVSLC